MGNMYYALTAISEEHIPRARNPLLQHLVDTYASESNKVASVWRELRDEDLDYRPHPKSSAVRDILKHQLLSERRFFGEFLGTPEVGATDVLPVPFELARAIGRFVELAKGRLDFFGDQSDGWWVTETPFFDVRRQRIWIFWRRVLHTAHHRTQLTMYLRLLGREVPATYGPTADRSWAGADPTHSVEAAGRR
jgi:uncharacterized damage-inducible protein DinB